MLPSGTSGQRIDEMVHRSEMRRVAGERRRELRGPRPGGMKRMASVIAAAAIWLVRH
jgi:hypothetical protein